MVKEESFLTFIKNTTNISNTTGYINILNDEEINKDNILIITFFNGLLFEKEFEGIKIKFSTNNGTVEPTNINNFSLYLYSSNINVNSELANYYSAKNIRIYNKYDKCFTEPCYFNKKLEFYLTQEYRKNHVYQKLSPDSKYCKYNSFEEKSNTIELLCENFEPSNGNNKNLKYGELTINIKNDYIDEQDKFYNLPLKCLKKIDSLNGNYAFWIFLIMCLLELIYILGNKILNFGSLRKVSIRKGLINDELLDKIPLMYNSEENDKTSNDKALTKRIFNNSNNNMQQNSVEKNSAYSGYFNKDFPNFLLSNFRELHPFRLLLRISIISPLIFNSWFAFFNILGLFGFNALIYSKELIEKRIYDKKRNKFYYPMRNEFLKIILSILFQAVLNFLIKSLVIVSLKKRKNLEADLKQCKRISKDEIDDDVLVRINSFEKEMPTRRVFAGLFMLIIILFFFYYSIVFWGIYIKTQRIWVYGGIWSLLWNWFIISPIFIILISYIEYKKEDSYSSCVYYLKTLFCF